MKNKHNNCLKFAFFNILEVNFRFWIFIFFLYRFVIARAREKFLKKILAFVDLNLYGKYDIQEMY